jgi:hypothetical protein
MKRTRGAVELPGLFQKFAFINIVVKILKPILTRNYQFCALEFSLQALFLLNFCTEKQQSLRKEPLKKGRSKC